MAEATAAPGASLAYSDSVDFSPRSRRDDSPFASSGAPRLRLMCSYGGRIVPRPTDRSLRYLGGETRIVVVDRDSSLEELTARLSHTLLGGRTFSLKYQLPNEDLDSLISVSTDEDLDNLVEEYDRVLAGAAAAPPAGSRSLRIRLFLFPVKPEASPASSIGSLLEDSKSETWFVNVLNSAMGGMGIDGVPRGLSTESASVDCLLGLEDDPSVPSHSSAAIAAAGGGAGGGGVLSKRPDHLVLPRSDSSGKHARQTQEVQSVPDSPMLDTTSSFGSASSAPSLSSLPHIRVHPDDRPFDLRIAGLEDQFAHMNPAAAGGHRLVDDFKELCIPHTLSAAPLSFSSVSTLTISPTENTGRVFSSDDEKFEHGGIQNLPQQPSKPNEVDAPISDSGSRSMNSSAISDPKQELVSSSLIPATEAADYQLPSLEQFQPHLHPQVLRQQQRQYIPANPHHIHYPATSGTTSVPPYYPIATHPIQQSPQAHPYNPQIPLYYYPLPPAPSYTLAGVPPGLRDTNLVSLSANTAMPVSAASSPAATLQPPLVLPSADQAHYVGMGYHVMMQQHLSQPPAAMPNYCYELSLDHSQPQPQMYYSKGNPSPALAPQHQPVSTGAMIADAPADPKSRRAL